MTASRGIPIAIQTMSSNSAGETFQVGSEKRTPEARCLAIRMDRSNDGAVIRPSTMAIVGWTAKERIAIQTAYTSTNSVGARNTQANRRRPLAT